MNVARFDDLGDLLLLGMHKLSSWFPSFSGAGRLAKHIGDIDYAVPWGPRRMIAGRLSVALRGELTPNQLNRLTRQVFRNKWANREVFWLREFSFSASRRQAACQRVRIEGLEHLRDGLSRGGGVILWEAPFAKKLLGRVTLLEKGFSLCTVHGQEHGGAPSWVGQRVIRRIHRKAEARLSFEVIDIQRESFDYLELLIDRLRRNGVVCMPGMGGEGLQFVPVEFLGIVQPFATGTASLAKISGALLIPIFCFEQEDGTVSLALEEPIDLQSCDSGIEARVQVVTRYAELLEAYIHEYPGQFSRWHNLPQPRRAEVYFTNGRAKIGTTNGD